MVTSPIFITPIDKTVASCFSQQGLTEAVKMPFEIDNYHFIAYGFYNSEYRVTSTFLLKEIPGKLPIKK